MNLTQHIDQACQQIAPLWPLANFVAVNPYIGFTGQAFSKTAHYLAQVQGASMVMPLDWYTQKYADGDIGPEDLQVALERAPEVVRRTLEEAGQNVTTARLSDCSAYEPSLEDAIHSPGIFSAYLDQREGTHWQNCLREEAAKWCAAYYDRGQATWSMPNRSESLYAAWHAAVGHDHNLACAGLPQAHRDLAAMPSDPRNAIADAVAKLEIPECLMTEWFYRVMLMLPGWAGHLRYLDREQELRGAEGTQLHQLLAILLNYERVLHAHYTRDEDCLLGWRRILMEEPVAASSDELPIELARRLLWQSAFEHRREKEFQQAIQPGASENAHQARPAIQAAFCIDVRSETFRRNLETALPDIQTIGFAGFFGVPLNHMPLGQTMEEARCPALLAPPVHSCECSHDRTEHAPDPQATGRAWKGFREGAAACFSFVETFGLGYTWKLVRSALGWVQSKAGSSNAAELSESLDLATQVSLAMGILKGLTLTRQCAPLVLLCGHGSATQNNPYASGLDCGACGGHPGDVNARIAAGLLNDPKVRTGLANQGILIPEDTRFIAGLHNTTTDEVTLFDLEALPPSHQGYLQTVRQGLIEAGGWTAIARAQSLNCADGTAVEAVKVRSRDWSQVRPEWGLAGNAGFIIAPRSWTRRSTLNGKAFLHEYDPAADPEGVLLESIMAGPMVVGSWINLQYYASATDNTHYGSGHKAIHNVVGGLGVALGNESDLRPGLPLQSVHDGERLVHEPSRLHVMVAADPEVIDTILRRHPEVAELVDHEWIHLFALGNSGTLFSRRTASGQWEIPVAGEFAGAGSMADENR